VGGWGGGVWPDDVGGLEDPPRSFGEQVVRVEAPQWWCERSGNDERRV
jgi:hypothetical protein